MEIIEITSAKQGNLYHTFSAYVQRSFGNNAEVIFSHLDLSGKVEGTIKAVNGDCFDIFWTGEKYKAIPAQ